MFKILNNKKSFFVVAILATSIFTNVEANEFDISNDKFIEINNKVDNMSYSELLSSRSSLVNELSVLNEEVSNTQSPSSNKALKSRISEVVAELSAIQKALIAIEEQLS